MNQKALIVLSNSEDLDIRLVDPVAQEWIERDREFDDGRNFAVEQIPVECREEFGDQTCTITSGSYQNDRAMACHGAMFETFTDMLTHVRENDIEVVYEFVGLIY